MDDRFIRALAGDKMDRLASEQRSVISDAWRELRQLGLDI
jgi:hypothetical protein